MAKALPTVLDRFPIEGCLDAGGVEDGGTGEYWTKVGRLRSHRDGTERRCRYKGSVLLITMSIARAKWRSWNGGRPRGAYTVGQGPCRKCLSPDKPPTALRDQPGG